MKDYKTNKQLSRSFASQKEKKKEEKLDSTR